MVNADFTIDTRATRRPQPRPSRSGGATPGQPRARLSPAPLEQRPCAGRDRNRPHRRARASVLARERVRLRGR